MNVINEFLLELSTPWLLLLKSTVLLAAAWGIHGLLFGANPRWRVLLWRCVMLGLLMLPLAEWLAPEYAVEIVRAAPVPVAAVPSAVQQSVPLSSTPLTPHAAAPMPKSPSLREWAIPALMAGWLAVSLLRLLAFGRAYLRSRGLAAQCPTAPPQIEVVAKQVAEALHLRQRVTVRIAPSDVPPFLHGVLRPIVVLPARMATSDYASALPGVLAHELAHVAHRDLAWLHFSRLVEAALWFHPLIWRLAAAHENACEAVCDGVAAAQMGDTECYSQILAQAALDYRVRRDLVAATAPILRSPRVVKRIRQLRRGLRVTVLKRRWVAAAMLTLLVCSAALACARLTPGAAEDWGQETGHDKIGVSRMPGVEEASVPRLNTKMQVGMQAPPFVSATFPDSRLDAEDYRGKIELLVFWTASSERCIAELPQIAALYEEFASQGVDFIGINLDTDRELLGRFLQEHPELKWPQVFPGDGFDSAIARDYGVVEVPFTLLLDKQGIIRERNLPAEKLQSEIKMMVGGSVRLVFLPDPPPASAPDFYRGAHWSRLIPFPGKSDTLYLQGWAELGGKFPVQKEDGPLLFDVLVKNGDDSRLSVEIISKEATKALELIRDEPVEEEVGGVEYKFSYPSLNVAATAEETTTKKAMLSVATKASPPNSIPAPPPAGIAIKEDIDVKSLPPQRPADLEKYGLQDVKINMLRNVSGQLPLGGAVINLKKVMIGETIPSTNAVLIAIEEGVGIGIEIPGTRERFSIRLGAGDEKLPEQPGAVEAVATGPAPASNATSSPAHLSASAASPLSTEELQGALARFDQVYRLEEGQILKHIPRPFIPERAVYWESRKEKNRPPDRMIFRWDSAFLPDGQERSWGDEEYSLTLALSAVCGLSQPDVEGPKTLLETKLNGDWLVRKPAETAPLLDAFAAAVAKHYGVSFSFKQVEKTLPAIRMQGEMKLPPPDPGKRLALIHVGDIGQRQTGEDAGSVAENFPLLLEKHLGIPVINESTMPEGTQIWVNYYSPVDVIREARGLTPESLQLAEEVLAGVTNQTGLTFSIEERKHLVWEIVEK